MIEERYEAKVDRSAGEDGCHPWMAARDRDGYGIFWGGERYASGGNKMVKAHRWGYVHYIGPIPDDHLVCHTCDNPSCQNPGHWFLGTPLDNMRDKIAKGRDWRPVGELHGQATLTEDLVREIRRRVEQGETHQAVADSIGVERATVSKVVRRERWGHVE